MLDDPFNGLDPEGFRWMRGLLAGPAGWAAPSWTGFAVLCGYAAVAFGTAAALLRRRDA
ncbi:MAG: hypothetical protein JF597_01365 [Streptomyces sp.]|uniref:hypothetical protein n=1 Tax=Streptomyces sp. TaxID=1931 RepID=UPI0025FC43E3|nr:hypothetical protein [Streptomyces sp.]MBW8792282.1 hypothetical protein [Streptomyces sp.]